MSYNNYIVILHIDKVKIKLKHDLICLNMYYCMIFRTSTHCRFYTGNRTKLSMLTSAFQKVVWEVKLQAAFVCCFTMTAKLKI